MAGETIAMGLLLVAALPFVLLKLWALSVWEPRQRVEDAAEVDTSDGDDGDDG